MKNFKFFCILLIFLVLPGTCFGWQSKAVKKANDFLSAGMKPEAINSLEYGISEEPTDHEAHFMLGKLYLERGSYSSAKERFKSVILLKPNLENQLGPLYKNTGSSALANGRIQQAIPLFKSAVYYDSGLKKSIAKEYYFTGKNYLSPGQSNYADNLFSLALSNDPSLNAEIKTDKINYGNKMLETAKDKPKKKRRKYVDEALKYLTQKDVDQVFPAPKWVKIPETYNKIIGKGLETVSRTRTGITLKNGDRTVATAKNNISFKHYYNGGYKDYNGKFTLPIKKTFTLKKKGLGFKIPKGEIVEFWIERLETSY